MDSREGQPGKAAWGAESGRYKAGLEPPVLFHVEVSKSLKREGLRFPYAKWGNLTEVLRTN